MTDTLLARPASSRAGTDDLTVRNARIVTADAAFDGSIGVSGGRFSRIDEGAGTVGEDWESDLLLPGSSSCTPTTSRTTTNRAPV